MEISPLKRFLICLCIISLSVVAIAPRQAQASPGIWDWARWIMEAAAGDGEISFDVASWVTSAFTGLVSHTGFVGVVGCPYDDWTYCAKAGFPNENPDEENQPVDRCDPCRPTDPNTATAFMGGGAFGYASIAIEGISTINPPFDLTLYANDLKENTIVSGEAYAQDGIGIFWQDIFEEATLAFWKRIRNLAYLLFVIIMIAMGFMVMLRHQVSPRVTVTVTSALPRIVLGLVLITFSYPIVSLAVDLIRVLSLTAQNLVVSVFVDMFGPDVFTSGGVLDQLAVQREVLKNIANLAQRINLFSVLFILLTLVALLITVALALWEFLKRFTSLIYIGIFGPLILAWGTLPGNEDAISGWFKKIVANVLALPAVTLFMGAGLLILTVNPNSPDHLPTFWAFSADIIAQAITYIIGISILWSAHKIPGKIDEALSGGGNKR